MGDLIDGRKAHAEHAMDKLRAKFGKEAVSGAWRLSRTATTKIMRYADRALTGRMSSDVMSPLSAKSL